MNSIWVGMGRARAKSVMKKMAPLRTPTRSRSPSGALRVALGDLLGQFDGTSTNLVLGDQYRCDVAFVHAIKPFVGRPIRRSACHVVGGPPTSRPVFRPPIATCPCPPPPCDEVVHGPQLRVSETARTGRE